VPSKYAARFAQCFSTTYETVALQPSQVCDLPDVEAPSGEEFSDGVGVITSKGMEEVVRLLPMRQQLSLQGKTVSAVQIRVGGCKGVLARWDTVRCAALCSPLKRIQLLLCVHARNACMHACVFEFKHE
jgi:hypothetical protein